MSSKAPNQSSVFTTTFASTNNATPLTTNMTQRASTTVSSVSLASSLSSSHKSQHPPLDTTRTQDTVARSSISVSDRVSTSAIATGQTLNLQSSENPSSVIDIGIDQQQRQRHTSFSGIDINTTNRNSINLSNLGNNRISVQPRQASTYENKGMMDTTYSTSSTNIPQSQQLPTLWQVLHRKTLPPVCLFNFYLYMRDHERSSEEVDFWLDVTAHEVLWRLHVRATKRRMTLAAQERERADQEREQEEMMLLQLRQQQQQNGSEDQEQELVRKGHQRKQPSVTLDMYEPHWSAANRYLEMVSGETDDSHSNNCSNTSTSTNNDDDDYIHDSIETLDSCNDYDDIDTNTNNNSNNIAGYYNLHPMDTSEPIPLNATTATPKGSAPPISIPPRIPHLPGAVPSNWVHPSDVQSGDHTGRASESGSRAGPSVTLQIAEEAIQSSGTDVATGGGAHRNGTNVSVGTKSSAAGGHQPRRGLTSATGGVTREDLQRSADRIYYRYLIPQAEKPVRIPETVRQRVAKIMDGVMMMATLESDPSVRNSVAESGAASSEGQGVGSSAVGVETGTGTGAGSLKFKNNLNVDRVSSPIKNEKTVKPEKSEISEKQSLRTSFATSPSSTLQKTDQDLGLVFAEAREIVFEGMESYYFPRFLQARAYGNMVHTHRIVRLVLGLFLLFIGFVIVLCMIFLNIRPHTLRAWALIPMFVGILFCTTFQFNICPLMVACGVSETKWMQFAKIKEPYIMKLHRKRAVKVIVAAVLYTACVAIVFGLLPGHRL